MNLPSLTSLHPFTESETVKKTDTHRYYWICQIVGWSAYAIWLTFIYSISKFTWDMFLFLNLMLAPIIGLILTHFFRNVILMFDWFKLSFPKFLLRVFIGIFLVSFFFASFDLANAYLLDTFLHPGIGQKIPLKIGPLMFIFSILNLGIIITLWSAIYFSFHFFRTYRKTEIEKWKMEAAVKEAELIALKSQINPHFIFNSLNNIRGLIIESPEKARDMITHLSDLLRYSIRLNQDERVSLREELEIVENYLQLESIQLEERLKYNIDIDADAWQARVPPMVIQILVENAIKHGIANLPQGGEIQIRAKWHQNQKIDIEVLNTGQLSLQPSNSGVGLKNASQRLQLLAKSLKGIELSNQGKEMVAARFSLNVQENT